MKTQHGSTLAGHVLDHDRGINPGVDSSGGGTPTITGTAGPGRRLDGGDRPPIAHRSSLDNHRQPPAATDNHRQPPTITGSHRQSPAATDNHRQPPATTGNLAIQAKRDSTAGRWNRLGV